MNFVNLLPEILLTVLAFAVLVTDLFLTKEQRAILPYLSIAAGGPYLQKTIFIHE